MDGFAFTERHPLPPTKYTYPSIAKFQQFVELKDYRPPTKKEYVRNVCKLAQHFQCDPATLTENQLREYFLFLRQHKHYKASPMKAAKYALLSFYLDCVKVNGWTVFKEVRIAEAQVLPIVLARAEVHSLFAAVREPRFRAALRLMYHCGLRVGEAVRIEVADIHERETPARLRIRNGKGVRSIRSKLFVLMGDWQSILRVGLDLLADVPKCSIVQHLPQSCHGRLRILREGLHATRAA